jgi:Cysteine-rich CPXCG
MGSDDLLSAIFGGDAPDDKHDDIDPEDVEEFEVGGAVQSSCPHCGESMEIFVDPAGGAYQEYVEDCSVCCRPSSVRVTVDKDGMSMVELEPLD